MKLNIIVKARVFLLTACIAAFLIIIPVHSQTMTVHFLAVGHGDAVFLEFPNGSSMLIDGGSKAAGNYVSNYIQDLGYQRLDYLVVTHSHEDHLGGLMEVIEDLAVGQIWECPYLERWELTEKYRELVTEKNIEVIEVYEGIVFIVDGLNVEILHPPRNSSLDELRGSNGASVVLKITIGSTPLLFAADIDNDTDKELAEKLGESLKAAVLKCAHHGSASSNSETFLTTVSPQIAVVSTGPSQWGYPDKRTLARIDENCEQMFRTDEDGDILLELDGETVTVIKPQP